MRLIRSHKEWRLRGEPLKMAIEADKAKGFIPFFVIVTHYEHQTHILQITTEIFAES